MLRRVLPSLSVQIASSGHPLYRCPDILAMCPGGVRATADAVRQDDLAYRPRFNVRSVQQNTLRAVFNHVGDEGHQITVIFRTGVQARRKCRLAAETLLAEWKRPALVFVQIVLGQA
jgi:hypothetical protein